MTQVVKQSRRYGFTVPVADEAVLKWMAVQDNKTVSLRALIRAAVAEHGYSDYLCRPVDTTQPIGARGVHQEQVQPTAASTPPPRDTEPAPPDQPAQSAQPVQPAQPTQSTQPSMGDIFQANKLGSGA